MVATMKSLINPRFYKQDPNSSHKIDLGEYNRLKQLQRTEVQHNYEFTPTVKRLLPKQP